MEAVREKQSLDGEAAVIEQNATPKVLMVLSPSWQGNEAAPIPSKVY